MFPSFVWAFGFASPWLLLGLGLGSIPIIIHLLHRRQYREMNWAAMRFLLEAVRKHSRRIRLEQLLLLLLRVLVIVLVVIALSRPHVESFAKVVSHDAPTHRIIVIDASMSMSDHSGGAAHFERAKSTAREIVRDAGQGDAFNLVRIAGSEPTVIVREPTFRQNELLEEIEQLQQTDEFGDVLPALNRVRELLGEAPDLTRKEVYIVSDFQRTNWARTSGEGGQEIRRQLRQLTDESQVTLVDLGHDNAINAAVIDFSIREPFVTADRDAHFDVTVRNFGPQILEDELLGLYVDDELVATERVDLQPHGSTPAFFTHRFDEVGDHALEVRFESESDTLLNDNRRFLALSVKRELAVLLVNGRSAGRPRDTSSFYLQTVLAPATSDRSWEGVTRPRVIPERDLTRTDLSSFDVVMLCNVALVTDREAELLHAYVTGGGGLIISLGDQVDLENYNAMLHRDGDGLLPARLVEVVGDADNPQTAYGFNADQLQHPIVRQFEGNPGTGLESDFVLAYVRTEIPENSTAEVVLEFEPGDPAIIDTTVGRGRVLLVTTSTDVSWGPWPIQRSFPPVVHEAVKHTLSGRWNQRRHLAGEPIGRTVPGGLVGLTVTMISPDGRRLNIPVHHAGESATITVGQTGKSGIYRLEFGPPIGREEWHAVNVDSRESDPGSLDESEIVEEVLSNREVRYLTAWQNRVRSGSLADVGSDHLGIIRWLLTAGLCLVFIESLMAYRFIWGFAALCLLTMAALTVQVGAWQPLAGIILGILLAISAVVAIVAVVLRRPRLPVR